MKTAITFILILVLYSTYGTTTSSTNNGNWNNTGTWDTGVIPPDVANDTIIINIGDVVTISSNTTYTNPITIIIKGTLFLNSSTLTLPTGSSIVIESAGMIDSNNNGAGRLNIGSTSWGGIKNNPITGGVTLVDNIPMVLDIDSTIINIDTLNYLIVYPNPIKDNILYFNTKIDNIVHLYFYNSIGEKINYNIEGLDNKVKITLDINTTSKVMFVIETVNESKIGKILIIKL